jgi:hypothetical protein
VSRGRHATVGLAMSSRARGLVALLLTLLTVGCAGKLTTQQAEVEDAFHACRAQSPSTKLDRVDRDGRFSLVGPQAEAQRVRDCMVRHAEPRRPPTATTAATTAAPTPAAKPETFVGGRLRGTWRGTLKLSPRSAGEAEVISPATVRFVVAAGALRWTLAAGQTAPSVAADGTAVVVNGELRMTGTVRAATRGPSEPARSAVTVRYAGTMVGDRLEMTGVTTDRQVHLLSMRRVAE